MVTMVEGLCQHTRMHQITSGPRKMSTIFYKTTMRKKTKVFAMNNIPDKQNGPGSDASNKDNGFEMLVAYWLVKLPLEEVSSNPTPNKDSKRNIDIVDDATPEDTCFTSWDTFCDKMPYAIECREYDL